MAKKWIWQTVDQLWKIWNENSKACWHEMHWQLSTWMSWQINTRFRVCSESTDATLTDSAWEGTSAGNEISCPLTWWDPVTHHRTTWYLSLESCALQTCLISNWHLWHNLNWITKCKDRCNMIGHAFEHKLKKNDSAACFIGTDRSPSIDAAFCINHCCLRPLWHLTIQSKSCSHVLRMPGLLQQVYSSNCISYHTWKFQLHANAC